MNADLGAKLILTFSIYRVRDSLTQTLRDFALSQVWVPQSQRIRTVNNHLAYITYTLAFVLVLTFNPSLSLWKSNIIWMSLSITGSGSLESLLLGCLHSLQKNQGRREGILLFCDWGTIDGQQLSHFILLYWILYLCVTALLNSYQMFSTVHCYQRWFTFPWMW